MSVQVAVRCRPFNRRERNMGCKAIVHMEGDTTFLHPADVGLEAEGRPFTFDHSFWSHERGDPHFASQADVWDAIGPPVLADAFNGYNSCIFAYGQTGAGKSYTMMGADGGAERGVTPRLCQALFDRVEREMAAAPGGTWSARVEVSYMEIYMEKVHDLLAPGGSGTNLRVREHKTTGPYVEGLTPHAVTDFAGVRRLIDQGNKVRARCGDEPFASSPLQVAPILAIMTADAPPITLLTLVPSPPAHACRAAGQSPSRPSTRCRCAPRRPRR